MKFTYKARNNQGKEETGEIEAFSKEAAAQLLQKYNIFVTSLEVKKNKIDWNDIRIERKVSKKDLAIFFRQLAVMLESRVQVVQSLQSLAGQTKKRNFQEVIKGLANLVEEGVPLSEAMSNYPKVFENFYTNLVKSGEASGNIAGSLDYISENIERENEITGQLRQAMVYPAFVISILFVVLGIIIVGVMPRIVDLVGQIGTKPPLFTRLMLGFYTFLGTWWWAVLLLMVIMGIALSAYLRTQQGKDQFDDLALKTPFLSGFLKKVLMTRFCGNIATLMAAGISINKALSITSETVNNIVYRKLIGDIEKQVSEGEKISEAMAKYPDYFPPFVVQMIKVGEDTGKLDKTLGEIVNFYQKEIKRAIDLFSSLIEPIMVIFLGLIVAGIAASVLSPLYSTLGSI